MTMFTLTAVDPTIRLICVAVLALMFLGSGAGKLRNMEAFSGIVRSYALLPAPLAAPAAWLVALLETAAGLLLLTPFALLGAGLAGLLGLLFAAALGINMARGHTTLDCGCDSFAALAGAAGAGRSDEHARIGLAHIARALLLAALALVVMHPASGRSATPLDWVAGVAATLAILVVLWVWDGLLRNAPKLDSLRR
jgi:uncharacterized membrane protein YphA (DoxX/SURF4 family)